MLHPAREVFDPVVVVRLLIAPVSAREAEFGSFMRKIIKLAIHLADDPARERPRSFEHCVVHSALRSRACEGELTPRSVKRHHNVFFVLSCDRTT